MQKQIHEQYEACYDSALDVEIYFAQQFKNNDGRLSYNLRNWHTNELALSNERIKSLYLLSQIKQNPLL